MNTSQRPWEGTALGVIDIIGVVLAFLGAISFLFLQSVFSGLGSIAAVEGEVAASGLASMVGGLGLGVGILLLGVGILLIFMARGAFNGQKWTVITNLVFAILGLLSVLSGLGNINSMLIVNLVINGFAGYCAIKCMKNSYYK